MCIRDRVWGIGNEVDLKYSNFKVWETIEILAKFIKKVDPNHPTMTVIAGVDPSKVFHIKKYCPSVDILGLNVYGSIENAGANLRKINWDKPYIKLNICENLSFLNKEQELNSFFQNKKNKLFQTSFYIEQRKKWDILIEDSEKPKGGKWSFDSDNRKKYPKGKEVPKIIWPETDKYFEEAKTYIEKKFKENINKIY